MPNNNDDLKERALPPIHRLVEPTMQHMSTRIRWYHGLGYKVGEIHNHLGVRYQQVRNVVVNPPKRAMREDIPPLDIVLYELSEDLELMDQQAMEIEMAAQRSQDQKASRKKRLSTI